MYTGYLPLGVQKAEHGVLVLLGGRVILPWNRNPSQIFRLILAEKGRNSFYTYRLFLSGDYGFAAKIEGIDNSFARRHRHDLLFDPLPRCSAPSKTDKTLEN